MDSDGGDCLGVARGVLFVQVAAGDRNAGVAAVLLDRLEWQAAIGMVRKGRVAQPVRRRLLGIPVHHDQQFRSIVTGHSGAS